jgi:photosystem II stability/assembly factor-like uncharacterized protein
MKSKKFLSLVLSLALGSVTLAGMPSWQNLNGPPNVKVTGLAVGNDQLGVEWVYAADDIGVFHRSNNGGLSWEPVWHPYASTPRCVATPLNNAEEVWIGRYGQGVSLSFNSGLSWYLRNVGLDNLNVQCLTIVPSNRAWAYAGCFREEVGQITLYRTTNWGETWSPTQTPLTHHVQAVVVNPTDALKLYAATQDYVYKTTDGGVNWTRCVWGDDGNTFSLAIDFESGPQPILYAGSTVYTPFPIPTTDAVIYKSTNDGQSWSLAKNISMGLKTTGLALAPGTSGRVIYATTKVMGVYVSLDWGATWAPKNQGIVDLSLLCVAPDPDPAHLGVVYVGAENTVYKSTDFGDSWQEVHDGMNPREVLALTTRGGDIFGSIQGRRVFNKSSNSGSSWKTVFAPWGGITATDIDLVPQDQNRVFGILDEGSLAEIFRSTDGGATWAACLGTSGPPDFITRCLATGVDQPGKAYVGGYHYQIVVNPLIWYTADGGDNWSLAQTPPQEQAHLFVLSPDPKDALTVYGGGWSPDLGALWVTSNGGKDWELRNEGIAANDSIKGIAVNPSTPLSTLYACGTSGVYKSKTAGNQWGLANEGLFFPNGTALVQDPAEPEVLYVATWDDQNNAGHTYVTVDGAAQWTEITPGLPQVGWFPDLAMDRIDSGPLYAGTAKGAYSLTPAWQFKPLTSASDNASDYNSQRKLVRQEGTVNLHAVYHSGSANSHNVYYVSSTDGGTTWSRKILLGQGKHPAIALDDVGNPQVIWLSDSGPQLFYAYRQGGVWSAAQTIYSVSGSQNIGSPAFCAVPYMIGCRGHVVFQWWNGLNPPRASYAVKYGWLSLNASGTLQNVGNIENAGSAVCSRPSIAVYNGNFMGQSGYSLHVAWTKGNYVYYSAKRLYSGSWSSPVTKVSTAVGSHDPSVDAYGDRLHVAWVEPATATKVMHRSRFLPDGLWDFAETVTQSSYECASPEMVSGSYCFWSQKDNGVNWEIYYSWWSPSGWNTPMNLSNTPERSYGSHAALMPTPMGSQIYCFWTEDNAAPYQEYFAQTAGPLGGFFTLDAGREQASPYTVHRGGYLQYAQIPEKTVDTDSSYLTYRFDRLDPRMLYLVRASYYQETGSPAGVEVKVDGTTFANVMVPNRSVIRGEAWMPSELYADSVVELVIRKKSGTLGTLAYLELCQAEPQGKGGPQSSGLADLSLPREFSLGAGYPNPMTSEAKIAYALPKPSSVDLTVYNISGQVVRRLLSEPSKSPGRYSVRWDGRNGLGQRVPAGVYFYRLNAGSFSETRKLVVIR